MLSNHGLGWVVANAPLHSGAPPVAALLLLENLEQGPQTCFFFTNPIAEKYILSIPLNNCIKHVFSHDTYPVSPGYTSDLERKLSIDHTPDICWTCHKILDPVLRNRREPWPLRSSPPPPCSSPPPSPSGRRRCRGSGCCDWSDRGWDSGFSWLKN